MTQQHNNDSNKFDKRLLFVPLALFCCFIIFSAAYDMGSQDTCKNSKGTLLSNGDCIINESLEYCRTEDGKYMKSKYGLDMYNIDLNISLETE